MSAVSSKLPSRLPRARGHGLALLNGALAAVVAGAGLAAYLSVGTSSPSSSSASTRTATAAKGVVLATVSATGALQSASELDVNFTSSGRLVGVAAKPGRHVEKGQVLGRIDATAARQALQQAETSLASAEASYQQTLTGETAAERQADALSAKQARQSLANTKRSVALDKVSSTASVAQAKKKLGVDQGQLQLDLAQRTKDRAAFATADAAQAAADADQAKLTADQTTQHQDQVNGSTLVQADQAQLTADQATQYSYQVQQTALQHQLNVDKATESANAPSSGQTASQAYLNAQAAVTDDNNQLDTLSAKLQAIGHAITLDQTKLSTDQSALSDADSYAVSQDQTKLSNDQSSLSALQSDEKTIRSDEQAISSDNQALASARQSSKSTAAKDTQSIASSKLSLQTTLNSIAQKQAPPTASALASAKGSLVQSQAAVANAKTALAETTLRAPIAGVVAAVNGLVGTQTAGGGTSTASTSSSGSGTGSGSGGSGSSSGFVTLTKLSGMQVLASFSETDAEKLRVGQPANVTVDAIPNKQLAAHVLAIASTATTSSNVVTYDVTFALDRSDSRLKPGMTANISVVTGEADDVVHVPTAAVRGSGRNSTVTVLRNGVQTSVPVVVGLAGDSSTAILSGLEAGDTVVLPSSSIAISSSSGGTSTTGAGGGGGGRGARFFGGGGFGG